MNVRIIIKKWKQPKHPSTDKIEYAVAIHTILWQLENQVLTYATIKMNAGNTILSERKQTQNHIVYNYHSFEPSKTGKPIERASRLAMSMLRGFGGKWGMAPNLNGISFVG